MKTHQNPLFDKHHEAAVDLVNVQAPTIHRRQVALAKRDIRDARRAATAADAIGPINRTDEVYGFTKGQFSVIDIIEHALATTGPARLQISTWTAANAEVGVVLDLVNSGQLTAARWLVDLTFNRRSPELANQIRKVFGDDAIRVAKNHAKFFLIDTPGPDGWRIVCRTSMNLNFNPRFENFQIAHDPELWNFHATILDHVWSTQRRELQETNPYAIHKHFDADL